MIISHVHGLCTLNAHRLVGYIVTGCVYGLIRAMLLSSTSLPVRMFLNMYRLTVLDCNQLVSRIP